MLKICTNCKNEKSLLLFHKDKRKADGHRGQCKACVKGRKCPTCKVKKDKTAFYNGSSQCKTCEKAKKRNSYQPIETKISAEDLAEMFEIITDYKKHKKTCQDCKDEYSLEEFKLDKKSKDGYKEICMICEKINLHNPDNDSITIMKGKKRREELFTIELEKLKQGKVNVT